MTAAPRHGRGQPGDDGRRYPTAPGDRGRRRRVGRRRPDRRRARCAVGQRAGRPESGGRRGRAGRRPVVDVVLHRRQRHIGGHRQRHAPPRNTGSRFGGRDGDRRRHGRLDGQPSRRRPGPRPADGGAVDHRAGAVAGQPDRARRGRGDGERGRQRRGRLGAVGLLDDDVVDMVLRVRVDDRRQLALRVAVQPDGHGRSRRPGVRHLAGADRAAAVPGHSASIPAGWSWPGWRRSSRTRSRSAPS